MGEAEAYSLNMCVPCIDEFDKIVDLTIPPNKP